MGAILLAYGWNNFHPGQKRQYTIGTTYMTMNNVFYAILNEQLANSVSRHGDRLLTRDPSLEIDKQVKQIDEFIKEKVDLIVIAPVDGNSRKIHRALKKPDVLASKLSMLIPRLNGKMMLTAPLPLITIKLALPMPNT